MQSFHMQPYDVLMLVVVGCAALLGAVRGMAWQVASLASIGLSSVVAVRYSPLLAPHVSQVESTNRVIAMLILFLATSLTIWLLFRAVSGFIDRVRLKGLDRQLGALFGGFKGVLLCVLITFLAVTTSTRARQHVLASHSGYYIAELIHRGEPLLPKDVHDAIGGYLDELDRGLDPTVDPPPKVDEKKPPRDLAS